MKVEVTTAFSTQTAIPELKKESKISHYLLIGDGNKVVVINIGKTTYDKVNSLIGKKDAK